MFGLKPWPLSRRRGGVVPSPLESEGSTDALEMEILKVGRLRWVTLRSRYILLRSTGHVHNNWLEDVGRVGLFT